MRQITISEWCREANIGTMHIGSSVDERCHDCLYWRYGECRSFIQEWPEDMKTKEDGSCKTFSVKNFEDKKKYAKKKRWGT